MTSLLQEKQYPLVSVIITGKNEKDTIEKCIMAVLNQSYPKFESIYIDSNSTDGTFEIAKELQANVKDHMHCKRYLSISVDANSPGCGRNHGVGLAQGEIIAFVDADCVPESVWLENLIKHFSGNTKVVGGPNVHSRSSCSKTAYAIHDVLETFLGSAGSAQFLRIERPTYVKAIPACNLAINRILFYEVGGFNEELRFNEDSDLCYRIRKAGHKILYSPEAKVNHMRGIKSYADFSSLLKEYGYHRGKNVVRFPWLWAKFNVFSVFCAAVLILLFAIAIVENTSRIILMWLWILFLGVILISSAKVAIRRRSTKLFLVAPAIYLTICVVYNISFLHGLIEQTSNKLRGSNYTQKDLWCASLPKYGLSRRL
jgi:glycosyltransferase involved in cell wall biosynthesis